MEKFKSVKVWMNFCYPVAPVTKQIKIIHPPCDPLFFLKYDIDNKKYKSVPGKCQETYQVPGTVLSAPVHPDMTEILNHVNVGNFCVRLISGPAIQCRGSYQRWYMIDINVAKRLYNC
jgi:hypothetical protein